MEDPKVPFADTTARRAELLEATERYKSTIETSVQSLKGDATEMGKTVALVAGVALGVFLITNAILPKSKAYRYAEKYGEPEDTDYSEVDDEDEEDRFKSNRQLIKETKQEQTKKSAIGGLIGGLVTSVLTNIAREQLTNVLTRIRENNAINPTARAENNQSYHEQAPTDAVRYSS
ncbi:hypothetical protein [Arsenicibacter rosenii]|uniref:Uncharacterized protein n=1 Tax=Arsenicibacter rosenii TaxID=1750698 RepID=A0A1S2VNT7_9BACT|nr:hypothetical protein [Arsenicibacter rosenii]OIN60060.1 hypothetical protein BLX24_04205 [Arsenicibacter rosenii]